MVATAYKAAGAEIRFHSGLLVSDLRYTVVDNNHTVIGLATTTGQNQPTREGYVIPSEGFAQIFLRQFQDRWEEAVGYDDYLEDIFSEIKSHNPTVSTQLLSSQLQVPESEVRRILGITTSE